MSTGPADTGSVYLCIDLKCFYASVECADRGLDPFRTNLVVADSCRGKGTILPCHHAGHEGPGRPQPLSGVRDTKVG